MGKEKKVAIIGKAPSSRMLAPYDDDSWEVWSLSDNHTVVPRWTRWFELHDLDRYKEHYTPYYEWLCSLPAVGDENHKTLYTQELRDEMKSAVLFPLDDVCRFFGQNLLPTPVLNYWTNSISYMMAIAIMEKFDTIGLWGVDMAVQTEYAHQKPSVELMIGYAMGAGIKCFIPPECDLMKCARKYAFEANIGELDRKIRAREHELMERRKKAQVATEEAAKIQFVTSGALKCLDMVQEKVNGEVPPEWITQMRKDLQDDIEKADLLRREREQETWMAEGARQNLVWTKQWA